MTGSGDGALYPGVHPQGRTAIGQIMRSATGRTLPEFFEIVLSGKRRPCCSLSVEPQRELSGEFRFRYRCEWGKRISHRGVLQVAAFAARARVGVRVSGSKTIAYKNTFDSNIKPRPAKPGSKLQKMAPKRLKRLSRQQKLTPRSGACRIPGGKVRR
jgi:hypothetical protein